MISGDMQPHTHPELEPRLKLSVRSFSGMQICQRHSGILGRFLIPRRSGGLKIYMEKNTGARKIRAPVLKNKIDIVLFIRCGLSLINSRSPQFFKWWKIQIPNRYHRLKTHISAVDKLEVYEVCRIK